MPSRRRRTVTGPDRATTPPDEAPDGAAWLTTGIQLAQAVAEEQAILGPAAGAVRETRLIDEFRALPPDEQAARVQFMLAAGMLPRLARTLQERAVPVPTGSVANYLRADGDPGDTLADLGVPAPTSPPVAIPDDEGPIDPDAGVLRRAPAALARERAERRERSEREAAAALRAQEEAEAAAYRREQEQRLAQYRQVQRDRAAATSQPTVTYSRPTTIIRIGDEIVNAEIVPVTSDRDEMLAINGTSFWIRRGENRVPKPFADLWFQSIETRARAFTDGR